VQPHAKGGSRKWPINHQRHQHKAMAVMIARWIADLDQAMQRPGWQQTGTQKFMNIMIVSE
jgi:hypothetical protein